MRWFFIDRLVSIEKGKRASALKNIALGEEYLHDLYPGFPFMPNSLVIEAMAQTGGVLVGHALDFKYPVFLAKVESASFDGFALPGDRLEIGAVFKEMKEGVCRVEGTVTVAGRDFASARLMFVQFGDPVAPEENFVFHRGLLSFLDQNGVLSDGG